MSKKVKIRFNDENDDRLYESVVGKKVYFNESQMKYIKEKLTEDVNVDINIKVNKVNVVEPNKVLLVKKYLDDNFVRASIPIIGADGYPKTMYIVGMKGTDGNVIKNMTAKQLFYLLQDKFKGIYGDKSKRNKFIKQVMIDWYNKKISNEGLLSKNMY